MIPAVLLEPLDLYCERMDGTLFSEPLNLLTNLAFLWTAYGIYRLSKAAVTEERRRFLRTLSALASVVGIGSGIFHAFANRLTQIFDVVPIALFVLLSFVFYIQGIRREQENSIRTLLLGLSALVVPPLFAFGTGLAIYMANGASYLGIAPALFVLAWRDQNPVRKNFLRAAALLFLLALTFRTLDSFLCESWPLGTHSLWHLLTAACAYLMACNFAERSSGVRDSSR